MLNAVGYVIKQTDRYHKGQLHTVSVKVDIDILSIIRKTEDCHLDFRMMREGIEFGVGWMTKARLPKRNM